MQAKEPHQKLQQVQSQRRKEQRKKLCLLPRSLRRKRTLMLKKRR